MRDILTFGKYYRDRVKKRVRKVPINLSGFTCPNIDGKVAKGGCIYCQNESFSPNLKEVTRDKFFLSLDTKENILIDRQLSELREQFRAGSSYFKKSYKSEKFIPYFQSFTNTYANLDTLKTLYREALSFKDVIGLSIGTRSDSITLETLDYLNELGRDFDIWLEYGVQSIFDTTLDSINRKESFEQIQRVIELTKERENLKICTHLIYGLDSESNEMMLESLRKTIEWEVDSIKIHPCYVLKRTKLANELKSKNYSPIREDRYIELLIQSLKLIPSSIVVQRVSAGVDDDSLLAPNWVRDKNSLFSKIRKRLKEEGLRY